MIVTVTLNPSLDEWVQLGRLQRGRLNRAVSFRRDPGGKGINVSRALHTLGGKTLALALAGGDDGAILDDQLTELGIPHRFITVPGSTRNNYHIQTAFPKTLTQINCPGPRITSRDLRRLKRVLSPLSRRASCVVLSGSLPPGVGPSTYRQFIAMAKQYGTRVVLDTSGTALHHGLRAGPWLIKPNRHEAEELLGVQIRTRPEAIAAIRRLVTRGPTIAIMSLGPQGALLAARPTASARVQAGEKVQVLWGRAPKVRVDSPVGAGDSLIAGFVLGYGRTRSIREAFRLGLACGTACAITPGTELFHRADVQRLQPRITIHTV